MNLFAGNIPHCHLLKYLLFLLKHPVYITIMKTIVLYIYETGAMHSKWNHHWKQGTGKY